MKRKGETIEQRLIKEKQLSDSIINSLPGIFCLYDETGYFLRWNKNIETISGYSTEEISKMRLFDFFDPADTDIIKERVAKSFHAGHGDVIGELLTKSGKRIPYHFNGWAVRFDDHTWFVGTGIDISERRKEQIKISETTRKLRDLSSHLQNIREEERKIIAKEMHDGMGQTLAAIKIDVSLLKKMIPSLNSDETQRIESIITSLDDLVKTMKNRSLELRPGILDDLGLGDTLEWQFSEFQKRTGIKCFFDNELRETGLLPTAVRTNLFRICQESLSNIERHSGATIVNSNLKRESKKIILTITDNGRGFDPKQQTVTFGLFSMEQRVVLLNGELQIESEPGNGTTLRAMIPVESD